MTVAGNGRVRATQGLIRGCFVRDGDDDTRGCLLRGWKKSVSSSTVCCCSLSVSLFSLAVVTFSGGRQWCHNSTKPDFWSTFHIEGVMFVEEGMAGDCGGGVCEWMMGEIGGERGGL